MAVALDLVASAAGTGGIGPLTYNSANTAVGATLMIVDVILGVPGTAVITGITIGGNAMTFKGGINYGGTNVRVEKWFRVSPPSGVQSIVISTSGTIGGLNITTSGALSFTGSDLSTPLGAFFSNSGSGTATTVTVTDSAVGDMVVDAVADGSGGEATTGPNTQRWLIDTDLNGAGNNGAGSTSPGAASVTPTWSITNDNWGVVAVNIKAAAAGGPPAGSWWW